MQSAIQRLNSYIMTLKKHILSIIDCESAEFLDLSTRLKEFRTGFNQLQFAHEQAHQ